MTTTTVSVANQMASGDAVATQANGMMAAISENIIYLMGYSFILGALFTIFILLLLDFSRHLRRSKHA
ncbi:MAG: hypothetical protein ACK5R5_04425 [Alphaproteobacteria bacterium]|jgi:hypothetical protein